MRALLVSAEDWNRRGGSGVEVYTKMMEALSRSDIDSRFRFVSSTAKLLEDMKTFRPDIVFSGAYHTYNEDGSVDMNVHSLLEAEGIPYVGSDEEALELVLDKTGLKRRWADNGILTPWFADLGDDLSVVEGHFPVLLKPRKEGGGRGIDERYVVSDMAGLEAAVEELGGEGFDELFAEQFLGTRKEEYTIAVIGSGDKRIIGPSEMVYMGGGTPPKVLSKELKDGKPGTRLFEPVAVSSGWIRDMLVEIAGAMCDSAGVRDYARCDIIQGEDGQRYAIEINGQSVIESYFHTGMRGRGLDHDATINGMFLASIVRNNEAGHDLYIPPKMKEVIPEEAYAVLTGR